MDHLILPLTKSSWRSGRVGPVHMQDWYVTLKEAKALHLQLPDSKILVLSNVQVIGCEHEVDCSLWALHELEVSDGDILVVREAYETMEQLDIARNMAKKENATLEVISTGLHYPRVRWLSRGFGATHHFVVGIPRPREFLTDAGLMIGFPILDYIFPSFREWFKALVERRRLSGKH